MEQFEGGLADHNVLARLLDELQEMTPQIEAALTEHVIECFRERPEKKMRAMLLQACRRLRFFGLKAESV